MARIFVSYRRDDTGALVGRLCDRLKAYYGAENVFLDIADVQYGVDYRPVIRDMQGTGVVVAVIGKNWIGAPPRISNPQDAVRMEIESALSFHVPILPVLADGAGMPAEDALPESLVALRFLNAAALSSAADFDVHVERIVHAIDELLGSAAPSRPQNVAVFSQLKTPAVLAPLAALAVPFVAWAAGVAPPKPAQIAFITAAVELAAMYVVMTTLRSASKSLERRFWTLAVLVTCVSALAYAGLEAAFVFQTPTTGERVVYGYVCTPEARLVYPKKCPWLGPDELRGAEYDTTRLWTKNSIALVTVAIDGSWLAAFIALGALSAGGVLFTRTRSGMGLVRV